MHVNAGNQNGGKHKQKRKVLGPVCLISVYLLTLPSKSSFIHSFIVSSIRWHSYLCITLEASSYRNIISTKTSEMELESPRSMTREGPEWQTVGVSEMQPLILRFGAAEILPPLRPVHCGSHRYTVAHPRVSFHGLSLLCEYSRILH